MQRGLGAAPWHWRVLDDGVRVAKHAPAGQLAPQETAALLVLHLAACGTGLAHHAQLDCVDGCAFQIGPVVDNAGVLGAPRLLPPIHGFVVHLHAVDAGHGLPGAHPTTESEGEFFHLADLALIFRHRFYVDAKALCVDEVVQVGTGACVEVAEGLQLPLFACQPGQHAAFDVGEVGGHQIVARLGHHHGTQARHDHIQRRGVHHVDVGAIVEVADAVFNLFGLEAATRHVLELHSTPSPTARVGTVVLHGAAHPAIAAGGIAHGYQFRSGGLGCFFAQAQGRTYRIG